MWDGQQSVQVLKTEGGTGGAGIARTRLFAKNSSQRRVNPIPHQSIPNSASRLDFDHIVRSGFAHSSGTDPNVTGFLAELSQIGGAKVSHAGLDAADQLGQNDVERGRNLLERLDALGCNFLR